MDQLRPRHCQGGISTVWPMSGCHAISGWDGILSATSYMSAKARAFEENKHAKVQAPCSLVPHLKTKSLSVTKALQSWIALKEKRVNPGTGLD